MDTAGVDPHLIALLREYEFLGLIGLGKLADPSTGEAAVDLDRTRVAIGILEMIEKKTAGNLADLEGQELRRILTSLRLNFVEESRKPKEDEPAESDSPPVPDEALESDAAQEPGKATHDSDSRQTAGEPPIPEEAPAGDGQPPK